MKRRASFYILNKHLRYDPITGLFWWKIRGSHRVLSKPAGAISGKGYRYIKFQYVNYKANRLAYLLKNGKWPKHQIDHKDNNRSNDAWANLREATGSQNQQNCVRRRRNSSGYKGVSWHVRRNKWQATCTKNYEKFYLGYFDSPEEAHAAYVAKAKEQFGEFFHAG